MKTKKFLVAGFIGGIVDWLLGWLFYGIIFTSTFPQPKETTRSMVFILLGCLTYGFFISFIFNKWAQITTVATGAKAGAIIGVFMGLLTNLFAMGMDATMSYNKFGIDLVISIIMAIIVGAVVGFINGKMSVAK